MGESGEILMKRDKYKVLVNIADDICVMLTKKVNAKEIEPRDGCAIRQLAELQWEKTVREDEHQHDVGSYSSSSASSVQSAIPTYQ